VSRLRIGIALGSGSARGWAHIGVLRALADIGVHPEIVCGTSVGALVGAAYASDRLGALEEWAVGLRRWDVLRMLDIGVNGFAGERLMKAFCKRVQDTPIETLPRQYGAVATDIDTGREVWFTQGSLLEAVRASIAIPGLFSPLRQGERLLVDGGLVNPVPVALCRALGADRVIAVNLNGDIVGKRALRRNRLPKTASLLEQLGVRLQTVLRGVGGSKDERGMDRREAAEDVPNLFDAMFSAINIMQDRITRSRLAGDPPDVVLSPRLAHLALVDFDRAADAMAAGRDCAERYQSALKDMLAPSLPGITTN
jgi:NTE family protein